MNPHRSEIGLILVVHCEVSPSLVLSLVPKLQLGNALVLEALLPQLLDAYAGTTDVTKAV
jgi:hypothetical protein